ncbi:hypothetical protein HPP92_015102 [Vanilla planifolia]|uniref:Methyltransferase n=1 Tax=Vanilla planifolia TaxID=51239 RepID=A0A835UUS6_VANPL|nr:hypothetical protein HPP92_015102 [Vanilla planifolia]
MLRRVGSSNSIKARKRHGIALVISWLYLLHILGVWQNSSATYAAISLRLLCPHDSASVYGADLKILRFTTHLDFTAHHAADDSFSFAPAGDATVGEAELLKCPVPAAGLSNAFQWPSSREFAWVANVPHMELAVEKAEQNWIRVDGEKFRFLAAARCSLMVASWGAFLLPRNILAMSFAPRDSHEAQVQFALERGVPAMIGVMASNRLPYPSRAFDMAHCSRCLIPWHQYEEDLSAEQNSIESVARSLCWKKIKEKGDIAIWRKPTNHIHCKLSRRLIKFPPFCSSSNPDSAWYTKMEPCITPLPEVPGIKDIAGGVTPTSFLSDTDIWKKRVEHYKMVIPQLGQQYRYHNLLDMNANLAGFAAALADDPLWVMNTVPTAAKIDTLGVIYERGLIGTYQDWCEAMSTYPRTYDFLHADSLFTLYKERDDVDIVAKVKSVTDGMRWDSQIVDHEDGPHLREKILLAMKTYWTAVAVDRGKSNAGS